MYARSSNERDLDSIDIQDMIFGRSSSPLPDTTNPSSSSSAQDALDTAINEIRRIAQVEPHLDEPPPSDSEENGIIPSWQKTFQCMYPHDGTEGENNPNSKTIEMLSKMQTYYERTNDEWRAISYRKAISALKKTKVYISTEEEARRYGISCM